MRTLSILLIMLASFGSYGQSKKNREVLFNDADRVVYIDHNKNSVQYKRIRQLDIYMPRYKAIMAELKDSVSGPLTKHVIKTLPRKWFPLSLYKNKYYLYSASDNGMNDWVNITDTIFIQYYFDDGAVPAVIKSIEKRNSVTTEIRLINVHRTRHVNIHYIDPAKGIAVFEYPDLEVENRYRLMIDLARIEQFPVIVTSGKTGRTDEWDFDRPDFNKLLQSQQK